MKSFMKTNRSSKFIIKREDWPFGPVVGFQQMPCLLENQNLVLLHGNEAVPKIKISHGVAAKTPQYKTIGH